LPAKAAMCDIDTLGKNFSHLHQVFADMYCLIFRIMPEDSGRIEDSIFNLQSLGFWQAVFTGKAPKIIILLRLCLQKRQSP
jgi:hypothetical protein